MKKTTVMDVFADVCNATEADISKVCGPTRKREVVAIRRICAYMASMYTWYSLEEIGYLLGDRHHTTVLSLRDTATDFIKNEDSFFMPRWEKYKANSKLFPTLKILRRRYKREPL